MPPVSEERLAELTDRLESGIKDLYASGRYADYLAAMSKFHSYSYGNALLILFQCPTATNVAGYNTWKNVFDRQVKRGEKGIQILAPCPYQRAAMVEKKDPALRPARIRGRRRRHGPFRPCYISDIANKNDCRLQVASYGRQSESQFT